MIRAVEDTLLSALVESVRVLPDVNGGSALVRIGDELVAVHDNAFRVTRIALPAMTTTSWVLAGEGAPLAKSEKPDFECAAALDDHTVVVLGSGSTPGRCSLAYLDFGRGTLRVVERTDLYHQLQRALGMGERPNIEGVLVDSRRVVLLHRGSGGAPSAVLQLSPDVLQGAAAGVLSVHRVDLGRLDGIALAFTDAVQLRNGCVAFLAAAEDAPDAIADGMVSGSVLGQFDAGFTAARWTRLLGRDGDPWRQKAEGLVIDVAGTSGWALTDADDPHIGGGLARLMLRGFG